MPGAPFASIIANATCTPEELARLLEKVVGIKVYKVLGGMVRSC